MEEILASIRRIIADDQDTQRPAPAPVAPPPPSRTRFSTLPTFDRRRPHRRSNSTMRTCRSGRDDDQVDFEEEEDFDAEPVPPPPAPAARLTSPHRRPTRCSPPPRTLPSRPPSACSRPTILNSNPRTVEDLVQDMLRPMLKTWLDVNLPPMVERLVRAEIERISRGGWDAESARPHLPIGPFPPKALNPSRLTSLVCSVL